jgi:hypothetical protein
MITRTIRELYDYIRVADDKKVKAIFMMPEDDITEEKDWWKDNVFVEELDKRYAAWESGKEKGYSLSDINSPIAQLNKKRSQRYEYR